MTDNEIIKALECCVIYKQICPENCPFRSVRSCKANLRKQCLELINRQKAEIERLQTEKDNLIKTYKECALEVVKDFAERLKEEQEFHIDECDNFVGFVAVSRIDNLLKEMGVEG